MRSDLLDYARQLRGFAQVMRFPTADRYPTVEMVLPLVQELTAHYQDRKHLLTWQRGDSFGLALLLFWECVTEETELPTRAVFDRFCSLYPSTLATFAPGLVAVVPNGTEGDAVRLAAWAHGVRTLWTCVWLREQRLLPVEIDPLDQLIEGVDLRWDDARLTIGRRSTGRMPPAATTWYHLPVGNEPVPTEAQLVNLEWKAPRTAPEGPTDAPPPGEMVIVSPGGSVRTERYGAPRGGQHVVDTNWLPTIDQVVASLGLRNQPAYSVTLIRSSLAAEPALALLQAGIRLLLFTADVLPGWVKMEPFRHFTKAGLLSVWSLRDVDAQQVSDLTIVDGEADGTQQKLLKTLGKLLPAFNYEQWVVEHAPAGTDLQVSAGAGTGKTTVMVRRIQFLLHTVPHLHPSEITMVTFTREATRVMRERLRQALEARYRLTGQQRYLQWLEELAFIQISTIPAFARRLLQAVGSTLGFGQGFRIRNFKRERDRIIETVLNEIVAKESDGGALQERLRGPLYNFVSVAQRYWTEMENKGLGPDEIRDLDWGATGDAESTRVQRIWEKLFQEAEHRLQALKESQNAISLADLTRQLHLVAGRLPELERAGVKIKYLFVDEFQDSDDTQIRLITAIRRFLGARLFVVGDIKQSIYRFRGATYTAFEALADGLAKDQIQLTGRPLVKNYRTSKDLLAGLDRYFRVWGDKQPAWLPYEVEDALVGVIEEEGDLQVIPAKERGREQRSQVIDLIREAWNRLPAEPQTGKKSERLAVLVRTNRQARQIKEWCENTPGMPFCQVEQGGTLFASSAAHDLHALVRALLYPHEPLERLNLLSTSFSAVTLPWHALLAEKGDRDGLYGMLEGVLPHPQWGSALLPLTRTEPVLSVIRQCIDRMDVVQRCHDRELARLHATPNGRDQEQLAAEAHAVAVQYRLNLERLVELAHEAFSEEFSTLYALAGWLELQRAVNRDEDEPRLPKEDELGRIHCVTVHASKGDEFHTVLVPFTDKRFRVVHSELLLKPGKRWQAGWLLKHYEKGKRACRNSYHTGHAGVEEIEVLKEEARLFYVALTRTKRRLWILRHEKGEMNWGWLLREV